MESTATQLVDMFWTELDLYALLGINEQETQPDPEPQPPVQFDDKLAA